MEDIQLDLLGEEEVDKLYYEVSEENKRKLLLFCSDDLKLKEVSIFDQYDKSIFEFIMSFKDSNKGREAFGEYINNNNFSIYSLSFFLDSCDSKYKVEIIEVLCDYLEINSDFNFDFFDVESIIKLADDDYKEKILDRLLGILENKVNDKKIVSFNVDGVINLFSDEKKLSIFNKFIKLSNMGKLDDLEYLFSNIVKNAEYSVKLDFLNCFLHNNLYETPTFISNVFDCFSDDEKDGILNIFYEYEIKSNKKIINDTVIAEILMEYSPDKRVDKFKSLIFNNERYDVFNVINELYDMDFKFEVLNLQIKKLITNISPEEKSLIINRVNSIFEREVSNFPNGNVLYNDLIDIYVDYYNLNKDNLLSFINKFGYLTLRYLDNKNIRDVINLESNKFNTFMTLFRDKNLKLDNDTLNTVINSILQREFMVQCKEDYNIFSRLEEAINKSSLEDVQNIFMELSSVINMKKILLKYNMDVKSFIDDLLNGKDGMLDILHDITNLYIMKKRELYVKGRLININDELDLDKKYEKNFIKKKWIATNSIHFILFEIDRISIDNLTQEQLFLKENRVILNCIINFKKNPNEYILKPEYKKYLKVFDSLVDILYENNKLKDPTRDPNAKYIYSSKNIDLYNFIDLISELDVDKLDKFLLCNDELIKRLDEILSKYKLLGWGSTFSSLRESADFDFSNNTLISLFEYFYKINSETMNMDDGKFSLTKMISLANCYASSSSKYGLLFGDEVFRLIAANEGKNKASMVKYKRLELGVGHVLGMYNREVIPIPPFDDNMITDNDKCFNVVVGNTTNMINLALGEATNSCMRIGGAFYDFYNECLEGKVGFHIILSEPGTDKFISRVSGIRNGNTIFLNELRNSECDGYSNEDCADVIRLVAKRLVEESKNSEFPIDNVVITNDYAMENYTSELVKLNLSDRKEALYGISHNIGAACEAIVLASSREDNQLVDISLGKDKISYYKPQRDKVRVYEGEDAVRRVVQLEGMINKLLNGVTLDNIEISLNIDVIRCISGSDWYIAVDSNGNYREFVLDNCKDKERALIEMSYYKNELVDNIKRGVSK